MLNQDKMIVIDAPPDAGFITRLRFHYERLRAKRSLQALPEILQPDEELHIVVGGRIHKNNLKTLMQSVSGGGSGSSFLNGLPGLLMAS